MTAKPETNFWKNLKTCLEDGKYLVSRIESYATPGFPDCVAFHKDIGFVTLEFMRRQARRKRQAQEELIASRMAVSTDLEPQLQASSEAVAAH